MRNLTDNVIAELRKTLVRPCILADIQFADQVLHAWSGIGSLVFGGNTYLGLGKLGTISPISETVDVQANGVTLSLSGVPSDLVAESLAGCRQGQPVAISFGFMDANWALISDPFLIFKGHMDAVNVSEDVNACTISVAVESRLSTLQIPRVRRFTNDDQQRTSPGDKGFEYVPMVQDWAGAWGSMTVAGRDLSVLYALHLGFLAK